jgi:MHS family proline/betaine transporter-like MFS transporter
MMLEFCCDTTIIVILLQVIGYIGDVSGRKKALEISIFLMALATTLMGCLPTYQQIGNPAILLLLIVRMLQGLSVGGQLMSSLVFTLEGHDRRNWGLYGSFVMACANMGTFLGGIVAYGLRSSLTEEQLLTWGWRIPFLSGILISFCGIYLKYFCQDDEIVPCRHGPLPTSEEHDDGDHGKSEEHHGIGRQSISQGTRPTNPLRIAFSPENRRSLLASSMVPLMWSGGFYLSFVWMAIYMKDLIDPPVPTAFGVNSLSLLLLAVWFPLAGALSDVVGRRRVMTVGGIIFGIGGPLFLFTIGNFASNNSLIALGAQTGLALSVAMWGAPMCAWLVESFEPEARLTSVSIGYNVAQALGGGLSPFIATLLVDEVGTSAPGILFLILSSLSLSGLWWVAPGPTCHHHVEPGSQHEEHRVLEHSDEHNGIDIELKDIT